MEIGEIQFSTSKQNKPMVKIVVPNNGYLVPASIGRRKWKVRADLPYLLCESPFHRGHKLTPVTEFGIQKAKDDYYLKTSCKECARVYNRMRRKGTKNGYVSAYKIKPYLKEIVKICGGPISAAHELKVAPTNVYRWLGDYSYGKQKFLTHKSAVRILKTFYKFRTEERRCS